MIVALIFVVGMAAIAISGLVAFVALAFAMTVVRVAIPKDLRLPLLLTLFTFGAVFCWIAYGHVSSYIDRPTYEDHFLLILLTLVVTALAIAVAALALRTTLWILKPQPESIRIAGAVFALATAYLASFGALAATNDFLLFRSQPSPPISISFEGDATHCVYGQGFAFYSAPTSAGTRLLAVAPGTRLHMNFPGRVSDAGWRRFAFHADGKQLVGYALANRLVEVRPDGTCLSSGY